MDEVVGVQTESARSIDQFKIPSLTNAPGYEATYVELSPGRRDSKEELYIIEGLYYAQMSLVLHLLRSSVLYEAYLPPPQHYQTLKRTRLDTSNFSHDMKLIKIMVVPAEDK
jgi:hypothetical protein